MKGCQVNQGHCRHHSICHCVGGDIPVAGQRAWCSWCTNIPWKHTSSTQLTKQSRTSDTAIISASKAQPRASSCRPVLLALLWGIPCRADSAHLKGGSSPRVPQLQMFPAAQISAPVTLETFAPRPQHGLLPSAHTSAPVYADTCA